MIVPNTPHTHWKRCAYMAEVTFLLDRDSEEPLYRQLIRQIKVQIESGHLSAGTRLPASRELAEQIDISRISVVNAYAELRAEGYLSAHAGRGTFVSRTSNSSNSYAPALRTPRTHATQEMPPLSADYSLRDMMRLSARKDVINFSHGSPPPEFYPIQQLRDAINFVIERDGATALGYERLEGFPPLRSAVRDYVSGLGILCSAESILITGGAQQGLDLIVQSMMSEGDTLITTNPTYLGVLDTARARRVHVHAIPQDEDGIRLDLLENYLYDHKAKLIYVMPSFHNPTGTVMPLHRRRQLINLAEEYRVPIVEDAVYHELRFEGESQPTLKSLDESDTVIHLSAFTKMLLPGLRIGYVIAGSSYMERLIRIKQAADISTSGLNQRAMHWLIQRGVLSTQLERNNRELRRRHDAALKAAERYLPKGTTWNTPEGGLYLWVCLPKAGPTAAELFMNATKHQVTFAIGGVFFTNNAGAHHLRINYSLQRPELIEEGFKRIGIAWQELSQDSHEYMDKKPIL